MAPNNDDDDDLNDILDTYKNSSNGGARKSEMAPLNLDQLREGNLDVPVKRSSPGGSGCCYNLLSTVCLYSSYICEYAPKCCCALAVVAIVVPAYFIVITVLNPMEEFGIVANDYTSIQSQYDLSVGRIDHWCLKGDNDSCMCEDPLQPQPRGEFKKWNTAHAANKDAIQAMLDAGKSSPDVAFLGASVVEEMDGRWFGEARDDPNLKSIGAMFNKNFSKEKGGTLDAVALGIAGDTSPSVLWRLMNGEMPATFDPKIWWIEVGMNDLGRAQCSEEVVVLGVLRVVEELLKKPNAKIVINSLFPMADLRGGLKVGGQDYKANKDKQKPQRHQNKRGDGGERNNSKKGRRDRNGGNNKSSKKKKRHRGEGGDDRRNLRWFGGGGGGDGFRDDNGKQIKMKANVHQQKKYTPVTHQERKLPLWTSITAINAELKKFANKQDRVSFFDATKIFAEQDGEYWVLKKGLISVRGHPSPAGFELWESSAREFAKMLLA